MVGINTAVAGVGLGLAVPVNATTRGIISALMQHGKVRDLVWARADTVVWLDLPKRTVMRRIIWRSLWRAAGRVELWNGNRERWRNFFALDKEESVIVWAWQTHAVNRVKLEAAMADPGNSHLRFVRLKKPAAVRRFLRSVPAPPASGVDQL